MRRRIGAAVLVALALTGCTRAADSSDETSSHDDTSSLTDDDSPDLTADDFDPAVVDQMYLTTLRAGYPSAFIGAEDSDLIFIGHKFCEEFDAGLLWLNAAGQAMDAGYGPEEAGYLLGAAITAYCPENSDVMP